MLNEGISACRAQLSGFALLLPKMPPEMLLQEGVPCPQGVELQGIFRTTGVMSCALMSEILPSMESSTVSKPIDRPQDIVGEFMIPQPI